VEVVMTIGEIWPRYILALVLVGASLYFGV
jgi:hypothetical protein